MFDQDVQMDEDLALLDQVARVVAAYVSHNSLAVTALPNLIASTHQALSALSEPAVQPTAEALRPVVPIKRSITPDFIICLDDGKKFKSMKGHLSTLGMTPDEYRAKWGLPATYPMVAPNYAASRSALAKSFGLGRKPAGDSKTNKNAQARKPKKVSKGSA